MNDIDPVDLLANQLMSYFGDCGDPEALAQIRQDMRSYSGTRSAFQEGLERVLADPGFDLVKLVHDCANRRAESEAEARAWLQRLQDALADPTRDYISD